MCHFSYKTIYKIINLEDHSGFRISSSYHIEKLFEINNSISISISIEKYLVDFSLADVGSDTSSNSLEVTWPKRSCSCGIKSLENWCEAIFEVSISIDAKNFQERREIDVSRMSWTTYNSKDFCYLWFHVQGTNGVDQFFCWNIATMIIIKHIKDFFEFCDGLRIKILFNIKVWIKGSVGHKIPIFQ